ncbi:helix-hairpin-helix domain-containing protein, partial [Akkermansia muciniphila]|uniref:helix-hairpin-helix domain-containing protein n=4 Tax=Akkermansia TaxID=239934 RepID=UPI0034E07322
MTPREAAIALNLIPGLGPVRIMRLLQVFATPELILESPASLLMEIPGIGAQLARHIS